MTSTPRKVTLKILNLSHTQQHYRLLITIHLLESSTQQPLPIPLHQNRPHILLPHTLSPGAPSSPPRAFRSSSIKILPCVKTLEAGLSDQPTTTVFSALGSTVFVFLHHPRTGTVLGLPSLPVPRTTPCHISSWSLNVWLWLIFHTFVPFHWIVRILGLPRIYDLCLCFP